MPADQGARGRGVDRDLVAVDLGVVGGDVVAGVDHVVGDERDRDDQGQAADHRQPDPGGPLHRALGRRPPPAGARRRSRPGPASVRPASAYAAGSVVSLIAASSRTRSCRSGRVRREHDLLALGQPGDHLGPFRADRAGLEGTTSCCRCDSTTITVVCAALPVHGGSWARSARPASTVTTVARPVWPSFSRLSVPSEADGHVVADHARGRGAGRRDRQDGAVTGGIRQRVEQHGDLLPELIWAASDSSNGNTSCSRLMSVSTRNWVPPGRPAAAAARPGRLAPGIAASEPGASAVVPLLGGTYSPTAPLIADDRAVRRSPQHGVLQVLLGAGHRRPRHRR